MKFMILAGGTGGHVFPALAVAQELQARGHQIFWMGAPDSFESRVVPQHGLRMLLIPVSGLRGKGLLKWLTAPLLLLRALAHAQRHMRQERPAAVLGMGGFAAGPGGVAAWLQRRPLFIHEQNAVAGLTNRCLAPLSRRVLQAFPGAFGDGNAETVGNPVRASLAELPPPAERYQQRSGPLQVLVVGGSQGARALNEQVPRALALLPTAQRPRVRHQAGRTLAVAEAAYAQAGVEARIEEFIADMAEAYRWADLVICRAGASTVSELASAGCAAILVPFPAAVDDHQTANARYLTEAGAARLLPESELDAERLAAEIRALSREALLQMASAARQRAQSQAARRIADLLESAGGA